MSLNSAQAAATFGPRLVALRKRIGMTQSDLARALECDPASVCNWERRRAVPQFARLIELADVLEVTLDELMRGCQ